MQIRGFLWVGLVCAWGGLGLVQSALAQGVLPGVYTCVDSKGRKLTADRPIAECTDREQKVLNPSGTLKARVGPSLTAEERAAQDRQAKKEALELNRMAEERRRERALLVRYPNQAMHDKERVEALSQVTAVMKAARTRAEELASQRVGIDAEMEFYTADPSKAPTYLRRQLEENTKSQAVQKRFIADQEAEARRVDLRFDDELARLRQLWARTAKP